MKTAVVILNYNGAKLLQQYLPSVIEHSTNEAHIYVADNASTDNSLAILANEFPTIRVIKMKVNTGYAGGYNEALSSLTEDYFVLLNSDVKVTKNWLTPIIQLFDNNQSVAACQPKILAYLDKTSFEYAGAAGGELDSLGYPFCRGRIFNTLEKDLNQYNGNNEVFWATGACLFIKRKAYIEVGGLDADYFAHMEEIDLCWRLKNAGHRIFACTESIVYHLGGGTLNKSNPKKTYLNFRNSLFTLVKNLPKNQLFPKIFIRLTLDGVAGIQFLLQGNIKDTLAIIKAHFSFYGSLDKMLKKRKKIQPQHFKTTSIVLDYFIKSKHKFSELS